MDTLVVAGGGELIEQVRQHDAVHPDDAAAVHWKCIELLHQTASELSNLIRDWKFIENSHQWSDFLEAEILASSKRNSEDGLVTSVTDPFASQAKLSRSAIVSVPAFYRQELVDRLPLKLPESWATTSDSIAVLLAVLAQASEIVLLKSCCPSHPCTPRQAHELGIIDAAFPTAITSARIPARIVNIRNESFSSIWLACGS